jgi:hypothetical protein
VLFYQLQVRLVTAPCRQLCSSAVMLLSDTLRHLDVAAAAAAAPAATVDAVLYNTALALMQGGGGGHAAAFTILARCSHLQVSHVPCIVYCRALCAAC